MTALTASKRLLETKVATAEHELKVARQRHGSLEAEVREARGAAEGHEARWREVQQHEHPPLAPQANSYLPFPLSTDPDY